MRPCEPGVIPGNRGDPRLRNLLHPEALRLSGQYFVLDKVVVEVVRKSSRITY